MGSECKRLTKEPRMAREICSFQIIIPTLLSTNYPPSLVSPQTKPILSQISLWGQSSGKKMYEYLCWCVCVKVCLIMSGMHTSVFVHAIPLCIQHTIVLFVQWIVRGEWRRMERKAVPAGCVIPCGECWLMNHIFLTWGCYCAAALSRYCRAPVSPVPACLTGTTWHRVWVLSPLTGAESEREEKKIRFRVWAETAWQIWSFQPVGVFSLHTNNPPRNVVELVWHMWLLCGVNWAFNFLSCFVVPVFIIFAQNYCVSLFLCPVTTN